MYTGNAGESESRDGRRKEEGGEHGEEGICRIYLYTVSYTFIYLYIPSNTNKYLQIILHTFIYPHILQNIKFQENEARHKTQKWS